VINGKNYEYKYGWYNRHVSGLPKENCDIWVMGAGGSTKKVNFVRNENGLHLVCLTEKVDVDGFHEHDTIHPETSFPFIYWKYVNKPVNHVSEGFAVMVSDKQTPTKLYAEFIEAEAEAKRLCIKEHKTTWVLKAVAIYEVGEVKKTELC
jgi:hypothetical protein